MLFEKSIPTSQDLSSYFFYTKRKTFQIKSTISNQTYKTKLTKANLQNQAYQMNVYNRYSIGLIHPVYQVKKRHAGSVSCSMRKIFDINEFQFFIFICSKLLLLQFLAVEIAKKFATTLSSSTGRKGRQNLC